MSAPDEAGRAVRSSGGWRERWTVLLHQVERVHSAQEEDALLARLAQPERPCVLAFANASAMNHAVGSAAFFDSLHGADTVLRDGSGMAVLYRMLDLAPGRNLNGTDFIPRLVRAFNGRSIALFGTCEPYLSRALTTIDRTLAPNSPQCMAHGFLETEAYVALAIERHPELIVLGMGMPRQEEVAAALRRALSHPCLIVCGGAIIDFLGGRTPRAPEWMRGMGLEWLHRLGHEPRRLFRRYVLGNPVFLARAMRLSRTRRG
ncbi:MAG: glycosyltransferase [Comamonadaceae bacterium]|nr:MAG: glycosyltransferase [Comamonadaceae bacterium]